MGDGILPALLMTRRWRWWRLLMMMLLLLLLLLMMLLLLLLHLHQCGRRVVVGRHGCERGRLCRKEYSTTLPEILLYG